MTAMRFVDTNVLVDAATGRIDQPEKQARAEQIVRSEPICLSTQVLQEFYVNAIRKGSPPLSPEEGRVWIERLARYPLVDVDVRLVRAAVGLSQSFRISYWDAAILAAAERLDADVVYSEDLNHGQAYGDVRVLNPFLNA